MSNYTVKASRWEHGWELAISDATGEEIGGTQSHTLADAERMVTSWLESLDYPDPTSFTIDVAVDGLEEQARQARAETEAAAAAQVAAARKSRAVAHALRGHGLTGADIGVVMGVKKARVSQLLKQDA